MPYSEIDQLQTKLDKIRQMVIMANQKKQKKLSVSIFKRIFNSLIEKTFKNLCLANRN